MQSTTFPKLSDGSFWWPSPEAIQDLVVEDVEGGFDLSAPDDTECGAWLSYWNQTPEHVQTFSDAFTEMLRTHLDTLEEENGKTEITDGRQCNPEQAEGISPGSQS